MRVIMPMAGLGKRMRPHTWSKPKPLLQVAGKPVLGHILDKFVPLDIDEVVFITGWLGDQIREYVQANYSFDSRFVVQERLEGQAHAVYLAREFLRGPCLILYVDTLFEADLAFLATCQADGVIFVKEVDDPRPFGVVMERDGRVLRYIEKPKTLEYRSTTIGVFWVREGAQLEQAIAHLLANDIRTRGEFYLADAFNIMIERGAHFISHPVVAWEDCGQPDTLLSTNRYLLDRGHVQSVPATRSVLVPPVHVAWTATIEDAVVGPYVSVGEGAVIRRAAIQDSIIEAGATIEGLALEHSIVGRNARAQAAARRLNIGDDDALTL